MADVLAVLVVRDWVVPHQSMVWFMCAANPHDFEEWESLGAEGWGYRDCLPYFKRAEAWVGGGNTYRGGDGYLGVSAGNEMRLNPLYRAFIDAGVEAGYPETKDYNGEHQEGFGPMHMTVRKRSTRVNSTCLFKAHHASIESYNSY